MTAAVALPPAEPDSAADQRAPENARRALSFTQHHADGFSTGPHPFTDRSEAIIARNLARTDLPEPIACVRVLMADGSRHTVCRRSSTGRA